MLYASLSVDEMTKVIALTPVLGFAVQRIVEMIDPSISQCIAKRYKGKSLEGITTTDIKKRWLILISLIIGCVFIVPTNIRLLGTSVPSNCWNVTFLHFWDVLLTGLIIGAGTEGVNTLTKYTFEVIHHFKW